MPVAYKDPAVGRQRNGKRRFVSARSDIYHIRVLTGKPFRYAYSFIYAYPFIFAYSSVYIYAYISYIYQIRVLIGKYAIYIRV